MMLSSQKKILIIGPSGAGKSTLCNAIINQMVDEPHLTKPAKVCSRAMGVTSRITNFWCDNLRIITDTIGFDDPRFDPLFIAEELRRMLKNTKVKYHKVILCLKLGRVSKPARVYLRLLKAIFDDPASNMILYISGCDDGTTVDDFINNNVEAKDKDHEDKDLKDLIDSLNNQTKKNEAKGIDMQNIITGTMLFHKDRCIDEGMLLKCRKRTLKDIMSSIKVDIKVAKIKRSNDLWRGIAEWFSWHFGVSIFNVIFGASYQIRSVGGLLIQLAMSKVIPIRYNYGSCPICLEYDVDGKDDGETQLQKWVLTACYHRFHQNCLEPIKSNPCPICREEIKDLVNLP